MIGNAFRPLPGALLRVRALGAPTGAEAGARLANPREGRLCGGHIVFQKSSGHLALGTSPYRFFHAREMNSGVLSTAMPNSSHQFTTVHAVRQIKRKRSNS